ncbi:hypothetical protein P0F27_000196 [Vibrio metschnikovii]|nr:hypothetical protein [Vibrio metschnikovii]
MDIDFYMPCQPEWLCVPFMTVFGLLLLAGLVKFIRIAYREYKKIERAKAVKKQRRVNYRERKGGRDGRPTNIKK